jgi:hypothetical protein
MQTGQSKELSMSDKHWQRMTRALPELAVLEDQARAAGRDGRGWWETWRGLSEKLSKLVGPGAVSLGFGDAKYYEAAHKVLAMAHAFPEGFEQGPAPWEVEPDGQG